MTDFRKEDKEVFQRYTRGRLVVEVKLTREGNPVAVNVCREADDYEDDHKITIAGGWRSDHRDTRKDLKALGKLLLQLAEVKDEP